MTQSYLMWVKWPGKSKNFYPKIQWFVSAVFGVIEAETKDKDSTKDIPKDRDVPYQRMVRGVAIARDTLKVEGVEWSSDPSGLDYAIFK